MKNTIENKSIKKIDDLGRIHIAKAIRKQVGIEEGDAMLVEVNECGQIVLIKVDSRE